MFKTIMEGKYKTEYSKSNSEIICKSIEAGNVLYKHASCQATLDLNCEVIVPIMFCTMFSPFCEASLQVDLPLRTSISVSICPPTSVPSLNIPSKVPKRIAQDQITSKRKKKKSKSKAIKEKSVKFYRKNRDEVSPKQVHSDSQELEYASSSSPEEDCIDKDPDNSEFSSDNDVAFWKKVERYRRQKKQASSSYRFPLKYPSYTRSLKTEKSKDSSLSCQITSKSCGGQQATSSKEDDIILDKSNSSVIGTGVDDDWITDDEVDEEEHENIDLAFKREWKERRLPPNSKEKNFVCEICGKLYSKHSILRRHVVRDHKEQEGAKLFPYSCQYCGNVYITERQLLKHQKQHTGPCEVCGIMLKCSGLFWSHRRDHDCVCELCSRAFIKRSALNKHMIMFHQEKTVPCPECNKMFLWESLKNKHVAKAHPKEPMPYKCDKCDFYAMKAMAVKIHQRRTHYTIRPLYTCNECNSEFSCEVAYKTHVKNHTSRGSIVCHLCSQKFTSEIEFQAHTISFHEASAKKNNEEKIFSSPLDSSTVQYSCVVCNIILGDHEQLSKHIQQYHYMDIETPKDIKVEIEPVEAPEADKGSAPKMQALNICDSVPQHCDRPIKNETMSLKLSVGFDCSDGGSALLMPASIVPPNVNMVDINGVQYHVIRGSQ